MDIISFMLLLKLKRIREDMIVGTRLHCWEIVSAFGASLKVDTPHVCQMSKGMSQNSNQAV